MTGYFKDNSLYKVDVKGNSETVYYVRDEDGSLIGINKGVSTDLLIFVDNKKISTITYITKPNATLLPEKGSNPKELKLTHFKWLAEEKPLNKMDIFR